MTYLHAHIGVVHVYTCAQVLVGALAQEVLDKLVAVLEVVSAAAPLPGLAVLQVGGLITGAALHAAGAAGLGHGVRQTRRGDGVQEGCFFEPCGRTRGRDEGQDRAGERAARPFVWSEGGSCGGLI